MKKPTSFGKYLLLERINIGGMAEVFRSKAFGVEGFERLVAVKRILPNIAEDKDFIRLFIEEAKLAVQLNHANIAQIFDLGVVDGSYYIALEHVHGRDLRGIFERCRQLGEPMPVAQACFVAMKVSEGLDYAHNKRDPGGRELLLVHRDVSPQNILVSFEGEVKLIDFGVAKAANSGKSSPGVLRGKYGYMSPEQVRALPVDRRSDVFSCGIVLYELLTGERLFAGGGDMATVDKVRNVEILPPSTYNRRIPEELERIVLKALARDVAERYQNAIDLHDELQAFVYTAGEFYSRKDLAGWMKKTFAKEIEDETAKLESYRQIKPPAQTGAQPVAFAPAPAPAPAMPVTPVMPTLGEATEVVAGLAGATATSDAAMLSAITMVTEMSLPLNPLEPITAPDGIAPVPDTVPFSTAPTTDEDVPVVAPPPPPPRKTTRSAPVPLVKSPQVSRSQQVPVIAPPEVPSGSASAAPRKRDAGRRGKSDATLWDDDEIQTRIFAQDDDHRPEQQSGNKRILPLQAPSSSSELPAADAGPAVASIPSLRPVGGPPNGHAVRMLNGTDPGAERGAPSPVSALLDEPLPSLADAASDRAPTDRAVIDRAKTDETSGSFDPGLGAPIDTAVDSLPERAFTPHSEPSRDAAPAAKREAKREPKADREHAKRDREPNRDRARAPGQREPAPSELSYVPMGSLGARMGAGKRKAGRDRRGIALVAVAGLTVAVLGVIVLVMSRSRPPAPDAQPVAAISPPAAPVPDPNTGFDLYVTPAGMTQWKLDGEPRTDRLPSRVRGITAGTHTVQIDPPPGFLSQFQQVSVEAGKAHKVEIVLQPIAGIVGVFESAPPGASVSLITDGKRQPIGPSPARASLDPRNSYQVLFEKPGFVSVNRPITFSGGAEERVAVTLERATDAPVSAPASTNNAASPPSTVTPASPAAPRARPPEPDPTHNALPVEPSGAATPASEPTGTTATGASGDSAGSSDKEHVHEAARPPS